MKNILLTDPVFLYGGSAVFFWCFWIFAADFSGVFCATLNRIGDFWGPSGLKFAGRRWFHARNVLFTSHWGTPHLSREAQGFFKADNHVLATFSKCSELRVGQRSLLWSGFPFCSAGQWSQSPLAQMGEMGEGFVQVRVSAHAQRRVQRNSRPVWTLDIGVTMSVFTATKNMKSPPTESGTSCVKEDFHARFYPTKLWTSCGKAGVKFPGLTRLQGIEKSETRRMEFVP